MNTGIIVDTSVWIEFFRKPESPLTLHLNLLLRERRVVMAGMVLAEILQGVRAPKEAKQVRESFNKLPYPTQLIDQFIGGGGALCLILVKHLVPESGGFGIKGDSVVGRF